MDYRSKTDERFANKKSFILSQKASTKYNANPAPNEKKAQVNKKYAHIFGLHSKSFRKAGADFKSSFFKKIARFVQQTHHTNVIKDLKVCVQKHILNIAVGYNSSVSTEYKPDFRAHRQ